MRSKDRLAELMQLAEGAGAAPARGAAGAAGADPKPPPDHAQIQAIIQEVERMRGWIHAMDSNTQLMRRLLADPTFHNNSHLQEQLDGAATRSGALGLKLCGALRQLEAAAGAEAGGEGGARRRIARLQHAATRQLYADALARHHAALHALRDTQLHLLRHQIQLTNLTISDEECQSLLESKNISLFVDNVRADTAEARRALRDVEARRDELARVEASLRDVRDLFHQLAYLVAEQQARVDSVEYYALQASEHVETGQQQLLQGTVSRTAARKKKISLVICVSAGLLVVLAVLVLT